MTEQEAESRIDKLIKAYCFSTGVARDIICDFLFKAGNLYKINDILCQIEQDED